MLPSHEALRSHFSISMLLQARAALAERIIHLHDDRNLVNEPKDYLGVHSCEKLATSFAFPKYRYI
jgi:hypothetical protein